MIATQQGFMASMRRYFVAGLLIWIPLGITFWVLKLLVDVMDQTLLLLPPAWRSEIWAGVYIPGLGVLLTVFIIVATGVVAANFLGKKLLHLWDLLLKRIPIVRSIYGGVKQISDTLFSPDGKAFRKAVLVRYPHENAWTVALLTGTPQHEVTDHLGHEMVSVFVPTTPNITAGFFLIVAKSDVVELSMSVDEALKYIISMGVAEPGRKLLPPPTRDPRPDARGADPNARGPDPN